MASFSHLAMPANLDDVLGGNLGSTEKIQDGNLVVRAGRFASVTLLRIAYDDGIVRLFLDYSDLLHYTEQFVLVGCGKEVAGRGFAVLESALDCLRVPVRLRSSLLHSIFSRVTEQVSTGRVSALGLVGGARQLLH